MFKLSKIAAITSISVGLLACGGGGDGDGSAGTEDNAANPSLVETGVFVDSAVGGVSYTTATLSGTTNTSGEFDYIPGEQVTFSIGSIQLPTVTAAAQVTPVDMAQSSSDPAATSTNIARLLQSLDSDGDPENGITIHESASTSAPAALNFDVSVAEFESNSEVINLVANSGSTNVALISAEDANAHLNQTLSRSINGLWDRGDGYLYIQNGLLTQYNVDYSNAADGSFCYNSESAQLTLIGGNDYDLSAQDENLTLVRSGDILELTPEGDSTRNYLLVSGIDVDTLPRCGEATTTNATLNDISGFYDLEGDGDGEYFMQLNADGSAFSYEGASLSTCFEPVPVLFSPLGGDLFNVTKGDREPSRVMLSRQSGVITFTNENNSSDKITLMSTSTKITDLQFCGN